MLRSNLMCRSEVNFRHFAQCLRSIGFYEFSCGLVYALRNAPSQSHTELFALALEPIYEPLTRNDRCCRHRDVGFCSWPLVKDNVATMPHQGLLDYAGVCKLIR